MSGDWAKIELNTPDKPEIWMIADTLDIDPDAAFGKVFRVWAWFDEHTENGNAPSVTKRLLDRNVGVTGFCDAMLQAGWMVEEEGLIGLPNFDKHNGNTAKKRANTNRRVSQHRENTKKNDCNAQGVTESVTREEKRREANKKKSKKEKSVAPLPPNFELTDSMREWFSKQNFSISIETAFGEWKDSMLGNANKYQKTDWVAAWRNGMRNADKWAKENSPRSTPPSPPNRPMPKPGDQQ